jgi:hypothetical protein
MSSESKGKTTKAVEKRLKTRVPLTHINSEHTKVPATENADFARKHQSSCAILLMVNSPATTEEPPNIRLLIIHNHFTPMEIATDSIIKNSRIMYYSFRQPFNGARPASPNFYYALLAKPNILKLI